MLFKPTQELKQLLVETYQVTTIAERMERIEKDFQEKIEEMPALKRSLEKEGEIERQSLLDLTFAFFVAGIDISLDKTSTFNFDRTELEHRRDLN